MNERLRILELIESGEISVGEGVRRLEALRPPPAGQPRHGDGEPGSQAEPGVGELSLERVSWPFADIVWRIMFGLGVAVLAFGGLLVARAYGREELSGLTWGWIITALGMLVLVLGWWLQRAPWFYLRVREHAGSAFTIALPLPLGLVGWLLRVARRFVPQIRDLELSQLLAVMRDELREGRAVAITVDEGETGDQVELYVR